MHKNFCHDIPWPSSGLAAHPRAWATTTGAHSALRREHAFRHAQIQDLASANIESDEMPMGLIKNTFILTVDMYFVGASF